MEISCGRMSESSAFGVGNGGHFLSGSTDGGGILDLGISMPMHKQSQEDYSNEPCHIQSMNLMSGIENGRPIMFLEAKESAPVSLSRGKGIDLGTNTSEEDDPRSMEDTNGENFKSSCKGSPWQRMKWTDNVVRLLITVVAYVGDDGIHEGVDGGVKRKTGMSQKKGKWKTISKIMIGKGCHVSPQQCEDKFNDLNKRYKKLNEILGKGTTCRVVENPTLMDSMLHLSSKMKEDVRKILSSKHLFYKEMCAYHSGQITSYFSDFDLQPHSSALAQCSTDNNGSEEEDAEDSGESEDGRNSTEGDVSKMEDYRGVEEKGTILWQLSQNALAKEYATMYHDPSTRLVEKRGYIKRQMMQLQEQRISLKARGLEIEKRQLKWLRFRCRKDRELEKLRLENERMKLENEQMMLQLRQKELELGMNRSESSPSRTSIGISWP